MEKPFKWVLIDSKNRKKEAGEIDSIENFKVKRSVEQVIGVAPGEVVACHSVRIPGKRRKVVEEAIPYALEEKLIEDVEELHFKLVQWSMDNPAISLVVSKTKVNLWIDHFLSLIHI